MSSYHATDDANYKDESIKITLPLDAFGERKRDILASRKILRSISSVNRIRTCQRFSNSGTSDQTIVYKNGKVVESRFAKQFICGHSTCPNCGQMRANKADRKLEAIIKATQDKGGRAQLIVATSRRAAQLDHKELIAVQNKAYAKFIASLNAKRRTELGIAGIIHVPEISYTEAGINPHSNILVLYSEHVAEKVMAAVEEEFAQLWISTHEKEGMPRPTRKNGIMGQEIYDPSVVSGYLTKSYRHGFPRTSFNNGFLKENGELDETKSGTIRNPHDILYIINDDAKLRKFFITLKRGEEIVRAGGLEFAIQNRKTGEYQELNKLPKLIRHWLDYETCSKNRNMVSPTSVEKEPTENNELFWQDIRAIADEAEALPSDDTKITINVSYDFREGFKSGHGVDEIMAALNAAALGIESSENIEEAIKAALDAEAERLGIKAVEETAEALAAA